MIFNILIHIILLILTYKIIKAIIGWSIILLIPHEKYYRFYFIMFVLGFVILFIGKINDKAFNIMGTAFVFVPIFKASLINICENPSQRKAYKLGHAFYIISGLLTWVILYSEIIHFG